MSEQRRYWWTLRMSEDKLYYFLPYLATQQPEKISFDEVAKCVGPGWRRILHETSEKLFKLGWDGGLLQVKEKMGSLRFYWQNNIGDPLINDIAEDVVMVAEWKSEQTCENCGKHGKIHCINFWYMCRCNDCLAEEKKKNEHLQE